MADSLSESDMLSKSKVSKGYLTVVPKEVRKASQVREGDILEWSLEGDKIVVRPRRRRTLDDVTGLFAHGGDAVASKRTAQRGEPDPR
jgi:AbrB family looped-hinge helix DNA binding protein